MTPTIKIVSLLQPPPETVANFDEIILLAEGRVIYSGPIDKIIGHFESLGYQIPERMDLADWLQVCGTLLDASLVENFKSFANFSLGTSHERRVDVS